MQYVTYTYVDALDPSIVAPAELRGGPIPPAGCEHLFSRESEYPTQRPVFYGSTEGSTSLPGILSVISKADFDAAEAAEMRARLKVPVVVTMRQARLALLRAGKLDQADAEIAKLPGEAGAEAKIEWEYATTLRRDHPLVAALGQQLELDDAAIDALFTEAAQIA